MNITVDGQKYRVLDDLGFNHNAGVYMRQVETTAGPKVAVRPPGKLHVWRWSTEFDRRRDPWTG